MLETVSSDALNLTRMNPGAAAIDIGSTMHMAAVNPDSDDIPMRAFGTFTHDLHDLAGRFKSCGVTSVTMESTGVYWIPAFEILEQHGFEVILVKLDTRRMSRAGKPTSAMRLGFANCIPMAC
ncbi:transposase [Rhizobium sp. LjRoot258]